MASTSKSSQSRDDTEIGKVQLSPAKNHLFKLNIDCLDRIFDYLSVKDLHSIGQTCKALQQAAGEYFKLNHSAAPKYTENDGIFTEYSDHSGAINQRTQTSGFNRFITYISHYYERKAPLEYIEAHGDEFESFKHLYLVCTSLSKSKIERIKKLFKRVEIVQIRNCTMEVDFYASFLKFCINLKELYVQEADVGQYRNRYGFGSGQEEQANSWLKQRYPKLEHFELIPQFANHIVELCQFFDRNPNVRSFSVSSRCLLANRNELLKSNAKLDVLEVKIFQVPRFYYDDDDEEEDDHYKTVCTLLKQLHANGFYNRLHFYVQRISQQCCDQLIQLPGLEKLCIKYFTENYNLTELTALKELVILDGANAKDMKVLACSLSNLQRLFLQNATLPDLLPFLRHSMKLNAVKFFPKNENNEMDRSIFKLITSNEEREKLFGARKVIVYVPDNNFLATKWRINNGCTNLSMVEMKRTHSYAWDNHY